MRTQYCRDNIDKVAENCGLSERAVQDVKQAADFCDQYREFSRVSTSAIVTLIRIKEPQIKQKAISFAQSFLNEKTPTGGQKNTDLTANKVREIIKGADMIVRKEYLRDHPEIKETIAPSTPSEKLTGPKEVDPATVATIAGGGILAMCETREGGEPCIELDDDQVTNAFCNLAKKHPAFMGMEQCPKVMALMKEAAKVAGIDVEQIRPSDRTGPFTPASEIPKGLVDLNTPDTRTDPKPFVPAHPITRTDPLDKACGVVKMQPKTTDYETLAKEGDMYPLSKLKARVMNQMVEYGLAADNLDANILYDKEGPHIWLGKIDAIIEMEGDGE